MKKISVLFLLVFGACTKEKPNLPKRDYDGKWNVAATINKEYTLNNGDTVFTKNDTTYYLEGTTWYDFRFDNKGGGKVLRQLNGKIDSLKYEAVSYTFFRMDSTLCEISALEDSSFVFNTLIFDNSTQPDKIQVTQDFFLLYK